jgi:type II secretory pathway component GspD/PulD (secretin)
MNRGTAFSSSPRVSTNIGQPWSDPQPIKISPSVGYTSPQSTSGSFQTSLWFGKLGALGDLDVQLALQETEDKVKILSTPRVTVLTNTQATINQSFKLAQGTKTTTKQWCDYNRN